MPISVLAAILLKSGLDVMDFAYLRRLPNLPATSVIVMVRSTDHMRPSCCQPLMRALLMGPVDAHCHVVSRSPHDVDIQQGHLNPDTLPFHACNSSIKARWP